MSYEIVATSSTPALIIYLIDISASMSEKLDGTTKIKHVNQAIANILQEMVYRSTRGEIVSPRYRLGMFAYSEKALDMLGKIETISDVVKKGTPELSSLTETNTHAAFTKARELLQSEMPRLGGKPAPMICHLTDGQYTGNDPEPIAREIMQMANDDGNVLIENIYVGSDLTKKAIKDIESWSGVQNEDELKSDYAKKLFRMSSPLPESYSQVLEQSGYSIAAGSRMLIPCHSRELIELAFTMSGATKTA